MNKTQSRISAHHINNNECQRPDVRQVRDLLTFCHNQLIPYLRHFLFMLTRAPKSTDQVLLFLALATPNSPRKPVTGSLADSLFWLVNVFVSTA